ncbi:MAG TPA: ribosome-associated translation inhibitor RaiA [Saprospiraceae bacterium]|nr:ribosome-associated translation inhibitor RaiA [Saprospiraceae bacterium]
MKLQIEAPFQLSAPMEELVNEKVNKLSTFFERITSVHVFFKDEVQRFQHKDQRTVEIRIEVPGNSLFASDSAESFEKAMANATQKLQRQLKKYKESMSH